MLPFKYLLVSELFGDMLPESSSLQGQCMMYMCIVQLFPGTHVRATIYLADSDSDALYHSTGSEAV